MCRGVTLAKPRRGQERQRERLDITFSCLDLATLMISPGEMKMSKWSASNHLAVLAHLPTVSQFSPLIAWTIFKLRLHLLLDVLGWDLDFLRKEVVLQCFAWFCCCWVVFLRMAWAEKCRNLVQVWIVYWHRRQARRRLNRVCTSLHHRHLFSKSNING